MGRDAGETTHIDEWGPVCRGFRVSLPDGAHGSIDEIRLRDGAVEVVVATGLFVRRLVTVRADEIEAILPAARRIVVSSPGASGDGAADGEADGGIVRMAMREYSWSASPEDAA